MRVFKIPFDIKREEKIFGGYLSLRQVLYLTCKDHNTDDFFNYYRQSIINKYIDTS